MPGPVSDSYDPEFGTGENAALVRENIQQQVDRLSPLLGERKNILDVVKGRAGERLSGIRLTERDARVIRFALERALESI